MMTMKLIDKSAVVEEIERRIEAHKETLKNCDSSISEMVLKGSMSAYQSLLRFFDTLKVKEVDLDKELDFVKDAYYYFTSDERSSIKKVAKHFFELGLKAQSTVLEEIDKVLSNPRKYVNADKSVEECMLEEITKIIQKV